MLAISGLVMLCLLIHIHLFFVPIIIHTQAQNGIISLLLNNYINKLNQTFIAIIYVLVILIQAIRLNIILNNYKLFSKSGFTTAFAFILFTGLFTNAFELSAALIANSLIIWIFSFSIKLYNNNSPKSLLYNLGFIACSSILLYQPAIIVTLGLLFALTVLRPFRFSEWLIFILGLLTPIYLLLASLFLLDNLTLINQFIPHVDFNFIIQKDPWLFASVVTIAIITIAGLITWYPNSNRMVIQTRKSWAVLLIFFLLSIVGVLFFSTKGYFPELLCITPFAAFVSNFFLYPSRKILINILLIVAATIIVYHNIQLIS